MVERTRWQQNFVNKLETVRGQWLKRFEQVASECIAPAFEEVAAFVAQHGFKPSTPLRQPDRRSFKFELSENAYALVLFGHEGIEELHVSGECFVPGKPPVEFKSRTHCADASREWARAQFEHALDLFVEVFRNAEPARRGRTAELELAGV